MPQAYALPQQGAEDNAHSRRPPLTWTAASRGSHDVVDDRSKYSHSGINILDILTRVSQRTSPQVSLGPVDMTCAMSVAHVTFNNASRMLQIEFGDVSDEFLRLVGQTRDRVLGQAPASVLPCADYEVQRVRRMYAAAANGIEQQAVMELIGPKQRSLYVLMTLIPLRYMGRRDLRHDNRGVEWIVGFQAEVTPDMLPHTLSLIDNSEGPLDPIAPHKPAIEAPTKAEPSEAPHEWQDLVAETGDAGTVYFVTWHDVLQYVSTSVESQLGYRADELIGKPVEDLCHPNDMVALFRELKGIKNKTGKMPNARARFPVKPVRLDENVSQHMVLAEVNGLLRFKQLKSKKKQKKKQNKKHKLQKLLLIQKENSLLYRSLYVIRFGSITSPFEWCGSHTSSIFHCYRTVDSISQIKIETAVARKCWEDAIVCLMK